MLEAFVDTGEKSEVQSTAIITREDYSERVL